VVTLVRAPNPSAMTLSGTNSYIVSHDGDAVVIDPGPDIPRHIEAILARARGLGVKIRAIALTHGHPDHAPGAAALAAAAGVPVYAHPNSEVGRDGDLPLENLFTAGSVALRVIDAPGHTFDHVVFYEPRERALFTGDVILGEGTVVIAPPGGAMRPYQRTLRRLADEFGDARVIYGGHGERVDDAPAKVAEYIAHRQMRERELLEALSAAPQTIPELVLRIYGASRPILLPAMARQMLAYLLALEDEGRVRSVPLDQPMDAQEMAIMNPPWEQIVGHEQADVIRAELGAMLHIERLHRYTLQGPAQNEPKGRA
jgi:glyoxylase-like metal-dependent hydrolase (beta-lactamase superfamily II)